MHTFNDSPNPGSIHIGGETFLTEKISVTVSTQRVNGEQIT